MVGRLYVWGKVRDGLVDRWLGGWSGFGWKEFRNKMTIYSRDEWGSKNVETC